jgi:catechol 2,3-dioxygenase-like lactoylglutathione lyase family enzyme
VVDGEEIDESGIDMQQLSEGVWPEALPVVEFRMARPTDKLDEVLAFYCDQLGLPQLYRTHGHRYEVAMVGLPGDRYHLEFSSRVDGSPGQAPSLENLLVFYFASEEQMFEVARRLGDAGQEPVELDNPWWRQHRALTFEDPDGWRVVLMPRAVPLLG